MAATTDNSIRCPGCGGRDLKLSRSRTLADKIMRRLHRFPFRCRCCHRRFYQAAAPLGVKTIARAIWRIYIHGLPAGKRGRAANPLAAASRAERPLRNARLIVTARKAFEERRRARPAA